jgi:Escherichia/Staphylococcus phage prohead protease
MSQKIETRAMEIRAAEGEAFVLVGRAVTYRKISSEELIPGVRERIMPGAFRESLASGRDVKALVNHNSTALPLGRLANNTLQLADGPEGLDVRVQLDKSNSTHRDVYASVKRGDISEMSFAFGCEADDISNDEYEGQRCQVRNVRKAKLFDVSVVTKPFYGDGATDIAARTASAAWVEAKKKSLAEQQTDWKRREKAHEITMALLDEK